MQLQRGGKGWRTCPGAEEGRRIGRRAAAKLLLAILLDLSSNDAGTQQAHAWSVRSASAVRLRLRGGGGRGRGADVPRVPSEAVGVFAPHGLQLRPVKWPSEEARAKMSDGEDSDGSGAAAAAPAWRPFNGRTMACGLNGPSTPSHPITEGSRHSETTK